MWVEDVCIMSYVLASSTDGQSIFSCVTLDGSCPQDLHAHKVRNDHKTTFQSTKEETKVTFTLPEFIKSRQKDDNCYVLSEASNLVLYAFPF